MTNKCYDPYCEKCGLVGERWESGKTYLGIDEHHNPPEFMLKAWKGKLIPLCRDHHKELHKEIIKIMFKHSNLLKTSKGEHWIWLHILPIKRRDCIKEVLNFTSKWIKNDTKTTSKERD